MILRTFGWSFGVTAIGLGLAAWYGGSQGLVLAFLLGILEISLSFDNAVVNATVLKRMNPFWQRIFLTIGVLIAVFGMRLLFPLLIVGITAKLTPAEAIRLALEKGDQHTPGTYGYLLHDAHPAIAAFGGMFLLMLFLEFVFLDREISWLTWIERPLAKMGKLGSLPIVVSMVALVFAAEVLAAENKVSTVLSSGLFGLITYMLVSSLGDFFDGDDDDEATDVTPKGIADSALNAAEAPGQADVALVAGKAAFFLFLYLEVLDASFSFDGVIGAFAITPDPIIILIGLGMGAMYIRSLTVYLVRQGTLSEYVFLEHGAHWAIGVLAVILLISVNYEVPEVVTGLVGVAFIFAALLSSIARNRKEDAAGTEHHTVHI